MSSPTLLAFLIPAVVVFALLAVVTGFVIALVKRIRDAEKDKQRILETGMPAQARVLQIRHTSGGLTVKSSHRQIDLAIMMEVHVPGWRPYQAGCEELISELQLPAFQPGCWLHTRVDFTDPQKLAVCGLWK